MEYLYAPWRDEYVTGKRGDCVFCDISKNSENDTKNHVLFRDEVCFVVMNRYPYTPGHFMVIPHKHIDKLEYLTKEEWQHISTQVQNGSRLLREVFKTRAMNIGMNIGVEAGAGIAEHLHYHIVPRWERDTNFITTIGGSRVYSVDFDAIYKKLLAVSGDFFKL
ncbi:MAG: adenylyltransferase [Campylobacterota bacterium]|nr:adenylyltransferase [Campylobacterota bacterium]